jgi:hypothetical protein
MQEFVGGTFGKVEPAAELLARLATEGVPGDLKAIHFGAPETLRQIPEIAAKERAEAGQREVLADRLREVEARVNALSQAHHTHGVRIYPADTPLPPVPHT